MTNLPSNAMTAAAFRPESGENSFRPRLYCGLLIVATLICYAASLTGPFVFDDRFFIVENPAIQSLIDGISPSNARALVLWSFAVNYTLGDLNPIGYHAVNLAIHLLAGLTLFGLVRRTLASHKLATEFGAAADKLALVIALVWLVHPLGTAATTYVCQRFESAAALCYLFGLYAFCRGVEPQAERGWFVVVAISYALGLRSKETMITFPLVLLWYDRALVADTWRELLTRKWLYLSLLAITVVLAGETIGNVLRSFAIPIESIGPNQTAEAGPYRGDVVAVKGMTPLTYLLSQPGVILHYLRLCFWPVGQSLDYGWPLARSPVEIWPPLAVIVLLLAAIGWGICHRPAAAFLGGAFFLILAPTSSFLPIKDLMFEHRMYLPLAAVAALVDLAGYRLMVRLSLRVPSRQGFQRLVEAAGPAAVVLVVFSFGMLTVRRNQDYQSERSIYAHDCEINPSFWRPHLGLALAMLADGDTTGAEQELTRVVELAPDASGARFRRGELFESLGRFDEALADFDAGIRLAPDDGNSYYNRGLLQFKAGHYQQAVEDCTRCIELQPGNYQAYSVLQRAMEQLDAQQAPPKQQE